MHIPVSFKVCDDGSTPIIPAVTRVQRKLQGNTRHSAMAQQGQARHQGFPAREVI